VNFLLIFNGFSASGAVGTLGALQKAEAQTVCAFQPSAAFVPRKKG
jgi:hypothetical protein